MTLPTPAARVVPVLACDCHMHVFEPRFGGQADTPAPLATAEVIQAGARQAAGGGADPMAFDHAPHRAVLHDFVQAGRSGSTPMLTGRSAVAVQRVIEAIMDSAQRGVAVSIDDAAC